jgi:hypothetical protein
MRPGASTNVGRFTLAFSGKSSDYALSGSFSRQSAIDLTDTGQWGHEAFSEHWL